MIVEIDLGVLSVELDGLSVVEFELKLDQAMRQRQREVFVRRMQGLDVLDDAARSCFSCEGSMISLGRVPRKLGTLVGEVVLRRRRLRCPECGAERYPLDDLIGKDKKHTLPVVERALYLATEISYKKASVALEKLTGAKISHGQIQALAKAEAPFVGRDLTQMTEDLFGLGLDPGEIVSRTADDTLVIAIDGGNIPDRASGDDFEAKVGVIYGLKAEVSKGRMALVDRIAYASLEDSFAFGKKLFVLARRHGVLSYGRVLAIGDGAGWIRRLVGDFFPGAIYLLDLFHLKRRLGQVLSADEDQELRAAIALACQKGRPTEALSLLNQYTPLTKEQKESVRKLRAFITTNSVGIANYSRSDLFGSGAVEKAVDLLVSRRFKNRGMSWLRPGAAGMLALRLLRFNGQWDSHWQWRLQGTAEATT